MTEAQIEHIMSLVDRYETACATSAIGYHSPKAIEARAAVEAALRDAPPQASQPAQDAWHKAVLDACMVIDAAYIESDPAKTVSQLIDWYVMAERTPQASQPNRLPFRECEDSQSEQAPQASQPEARPGAAEPVAWPGGSHQFHVDLLNMGKAMAKERSREIGDAWNQLADLLALLSKSRAAQKGKP